MTTHRLLVTRVGARGSLWVATVPCKTAADGFVHDLFVAIGNLLTPRTGSRSLSSNETGFGSEVAGSVAAKCGYSRFPLPARCDDPPPPNRDATGGLNVGSTNYVAVDGGWADRDCVHCHGTGYTGHGSEIEACECFVDRTNYSPDFGPIPDEQGEWR